MNILCLNNSRHKVAELWSTQIFPHAFLALCVHWASWTFVRDKTCLSLCS